MRVVITTIMLFSCLAIAKQDDPIIDVEVIILEIPPAGWVTSTTGTEIIMIKGLPDDVEIVGLPQGWEGKGQSVPDDVEIVGLPPPWVGKGRGFILLQGPPTGDKITIKFTSPDPNWEAYVEGFIGMEPHWDAGLLTRDSAGIKTIIMKADGVLNSPAAKCFRAKQKADSYKSSRLKNKNIKGEPANASDVVGAWVSEPTLGQLGVSQESYSFQDDGSYSLKHDSISFCDGCNRGIDCDYFWMIVEGNYNVGDGVITVNPENVKRVILTTGQAEPVITESSEYPPSYEIIVERTGDKLLIRKSADDEASVFKREK